MIATRFQADLRRLATAMRSSQELPSDRELEDVGRQLTSDLSEAGTKAIELHDQFRRFEAIRAGLNQLRFKDRFFAVTKIVVGSVGFTSAIATIAGYLGHPFTDTTVVPVILLLGMGLGAYAAITVDALQAADERHRRASAEHDAALLLAAIRTGAAAQASIDGLQGGPDTKAAVTQRRAAEKAATTARAAASDAIERVYSELPGLHD